MRLHAVLSKICLRTLFLSFQNKIASFVSYYRNIHIKKKKKSCCLFVFHKQTRFVEFTLGRIPKKSEPIRILEENTQIVSPMCRKTKLPPI